METTEIRRVRTPASRIGLGTWPMGGVQWGGTDDDESVRTIHAALDRGITLIDTAPMYGNCEAIIAEAFNGKLPAGIRITSSGTANSASPNPNADRMSVARKMTART